VAMRIGAILVLAGDGLRPLCLLWAQTAAAESRTVWGTGVYTEEQASAGTDLSTGYARLPRATCSTGAGNLATADGRRILAIGTASPMG